MIPGGLPSWEGRFDGRFKRLLEPQTLQRKQALPKSPGAELFRAGKSLITYICFYGNFWEARRGNGSVSSPNVDGNLHTGPGIPRRSGPWAVAGVIK